ncbi:MAG: PAS domain-containing protein [Candidatus Obscuribacter sp.]|nr:PAS domain-containing protein [Candidatus Obscuribacter sp.]MBK9619296.1 PAS domain-containing protein [Candidatus Obscuribacter sp.]MBP6349298.1 PAS domain-containing protein [Candidatus Obscuribacter sp.]MBP6592026.1 PAS domain-containing protein [Candidatus Obscuribacter sp.]MBP7575420.1 PAS domain-containing protein [Candidatus Obscuribacter sp.]
MALKFAHKVLILVTVPVLFEVGLVTYVTGLFDQIEKSRIKAVRARELTEHLNAIVNLHVQRVTTLIARKFKANSSEGPEETNLKKKIRGKIEVMRLVSTSDLQLQKKWIRLTELEAEIDKTFDSAFTAYQAGNDVQASMLWAGAHSKINELVTISNQLTADQQNEQILSQTEYAAFDTQLRNTLKLSLLLSAAMAFGMAIFFNQSTTNRLNKLVHNTSLLAVGEAPDTAIGGTDELAQIDAIQHQMHEQLTQMRQKERAVLENAAEAICSLNADLKLTEYNGAAAQLWDWQSDNMLGARLEDLISDEDLDRVISKLEQAETEENAVRFEAKIKTGITGDQSATGSAGLPALLDTAWSATWSQANAELYCVITDVSARKQLDQLKQDFVAMLSHDLRTPLNSVQASLEIVNSRHYQLPDEARQYINKAEHNLKLSLALINQLLEIEKMESGVITLALDAVNSQTIYNRAYESIAALADNKKVKLAYTGANVEFVGDLDRLVQVQINLIANALNYSEPGTKITVRGELRQEPNGANFARISVTDQGDGIAADKLGQIFDRFRQAEPTDNRAKAGSGLGLAICKAIIEAHNGKIGVTSSVGIGSTFWYQIPID